MAILDLGFGIQKLIWVWDLSNGDIGFRVWDLEIDIGFWVWDLEMNL